MFLVSRLCITVSPWMLAVPNLLNLQWIFYKRHIFRGTFLQDCFEIEFQWNPKEMSYDYASLHLEYLWFQLPCRNIIILIFLAKNINIFELCSKKKSKINSHFGREKEFDPVSLNILKNMFSIHKEIEDSLEDMFPWYRYILSTDTLLVY